MTLFLLEHRRDVDTGQPLDKTHAILLRADNEVHARMMAATGSFSDDDDPAVPVPVYGDEGPEFWLNSMKSSCRVITEEGPPAILHVGVR